MKAKRILALILSVLLVVTGMPVVLADEADVPVEAETAENETYNAAATSGTCGANGDNLKWEFAEGTLTISGTGKMWDYSVYDGNPAPWAEYDVKTVNIEKGVTNIGDHTFVFCTALQSVSIPNTVTEIGYMAFYGCESLRSVTVPGSVTIIGNEAFADCTSLQSVTMEKGVTLIDSGAFWNCVALQSVSIPNSVTEIGQNAFAGCTSLKSVTIPNSVTSLGFYAFADCAALQSVTVSNRMTHIGLETFENCTSLQSVTIPNGVKVIERMAFLNCPALKSVVIPASVIEIWPDAFGYDDAFKKVPGFTLYGVSGGAAETYAKENGFLFKKSDTAKQLATPEVTSVTANSATSVTVKWDKVAGAENYQVFYKGGGKTGWTKLAAVTGTSYTWTNAKAGTKYSFTVRCLSKDGKKYTSDYDKTGKSVTTPKASAKLSAPKLSSVQNTSTGVKISWNAVSAATKYKLYYKTTGGWKSLASTKETSYTWTKAKAGTKYTFTVRAVDKNDKTSGYDKTGKAVTYVKQSNVSKVENTTTGVKITWKKSSGAAKYTLYYKTTGGWKKIGTTKKTSYTWKKAKSGTKYAFTVKALAKDNSAASYSNTGKSIVWVAPPKNLAVKKSGSTGITVSWEYTSGALVYRIYYKTGSGSWKKLEDVVSNSYTWTKAKKGVKYTFTVRSIEYGGELSAYDKTGVSITL